MYGSKQNIKVQGRDSMTSFLMALLKDESVYKRERGRGTILVHSDRPPRTRPRARMVWELGKWEEYSICATIFSVGTCSVGRRDSGRPRYRISRTLLQCLAIQVCDLYQAKSENHHVYRIVANVALP